MSKDINAVMKKFSKLAEKFHKIWQIELTLYVNWQQPPREFYILVFPKGHRHNDELYFASSTATSDFLESMQEINTELEMKLKAR